jgi:hypothetical protein
MSAPGPFPPVPPVPPTRTIPAAPQAVEAPALRSSALRRDSVSVALGVAFLAAAVMVSTTRARSGAGADLDLSVFLVGVGATLALLGFGLAARATLGDPETARTLASWPLAFGAVGAGLMVALGLDDGASTAYVAGLVVLVLAAAGYVLAPSAPPVVAGIVGVLAVYGQGFSDVAGVDLAEDDGFKTLAVAVLVFVVLVTAISWALPSARTTAPVVAGVGAVLAYTGILAAIAFTAAIGAAFSGFDETGEPPAPPSYDSDVYLTFALAALMIAGWLVLGHLTDSAGYKVLVVAMLATVFPAGIGLLAVEHPTVWGFVVGLLGALVLGLVGLRAATGRPTRTATPVG